MFLITTADERTWKTDERIMFLGEWCKLYSRKQIWSGLDYEVVPYHWDDRNQMYRDYKYLSNSYEDYLKALSEILNKVHGCSYSIRYWRIVIGPWLRYFMDVIYDRYCSIEAAAGSAQVTSTWIMESDVNEWIPKDFGHFYSDFTTDQWNHFIYGEIIKAIGGIPYSVVGEKNIPVNHDGRSGSLSILGKIKKYIINPYASIVSDRFNSIVFISSYFTRIRDLIKLQISLGQMPYPYGPTVKIPGVKCEMAIRSKFKIDIASNRFEQILENLIPWQMPKCYLEGYTLIRELASRNFPKSAKAIYTANAYSHNDSFKIWAANKVEKGAKLFIGQHGGNMGSALWNQSEDHQIDISDRFYSWGWKNRYTYKVKPLPGSKLTYSRKNLIPNPKGPILYTVVSLPRYYYCMYSVPAASQYLKYIDEQIAFVKSVSRPVFDLLKFRTDPADFGWNFRSRLRDASLGDIIDDSKKILIRRLKECRLCIATHNATIFLETFAADYPTILFWNPHYYELRPEAKPYYERLHKAGILHYNPKSAGKALNKIYNDPLGWWHQGHIQVAKNTFCERFAYTNDNWLKEWKHELVSSMSKHHHP